MEPATGMLVSLLKPLVSVTSDKWERRAEFRLLRHLAHERLSRELTWNLECLRNQTRQEGYLAFLRTDAFDALVTADLPMDRLFSDTVQQDWCDLDPFTTERNTGEQFRQRISSCSTVSDLLDQLYQRFWMLKHRLSTGLSLGDLKYLQKLTLLTMAHVNLRRREMRPDRMSVRAWLTQWQQEESAEKN